MKFFAGILLIVALFGTILTLPTRYEAEEQLQESVQRPQRQAGGHHHHDAVDFGAHTGEHGAFGWYADFPVDVHK